jgi:hypothetical protein
VFFLFAERDSTDYRLSTILLLEPLLVVGSPSCFAIHPTIDASLNANPEALTPIETMLNPKIKSFF